MGEKWTSARRRGDLTELLADGERTNHAETDCAIRAVESRFSRRLASQMRGSKYFCASKNRSWKRWRGSDGSFFTRTMVNFSLVIWAQTDQTAVSNSAKTEVDEVDIAVQLRLCRVGHKVLRWFSHRALWKFPSASRSSSVPTCLKALHLLCEFNALWSHKRRESSSPFKNPIWPPSSLPHNLYPQTVAWLLLETLSPLWLCCSSIYSLLLKKKDDFKRKLTHTCQWASI